MVEDIEFKITRAKLKLQFEYPFFGFLLLKAKLRKEENSELKGNPIGVSKDMVIVYSPEVFAGLDEETIKAILLHELLHVTLKHFDRMDNRDNRIWNMACDFVVNFTIRNMSSDMWDCIDKFYKSKGIDFFSFYDFILKDIDEEKDLFAEKIYDMLLRELNDRNIESFTIDLHKYETEGYMSDYEVVQSIFDAYTFNEISKGNLPSVIESIIEKLRKPKVNWKRFLNGIFTGMDYSDFTYSRYSKKSHLISKDYRVPGLLKSDCSRFLVCIDVSGSILIEDIEKFVSEVKALSNLLEIEGDVLFHDVDIVKIIPIRDFKIPFTLKTGGGTSHLWLLNIDFRKYDRIILFTDGYSEFPKLLEPVSKFVWFVTTDDGFEILKNKNLGNVFKYE